MIVVRSFVTQISFQVKVIVIFLIDIMIVEPPRPVIQTNSLVRHNTINNQTRHHPSFIEEQKEARRRRLHRDRDSIALLV